jgi:hypothetical protein
MRVRRPSGRIDPVVDDDAEQHSTHVEGTEMSASIGSTQPHTGAHAVVADALARTTVQAPAADTDPARRPDVLFRVRHEDDHQLSAWWMIGAFVLVSGAVIAMLSFIPGGH